MKRNRSFRQYLLIYLAAVVGVFALAASIYELRNERNYKKVILQTRLEGYADRVALLGAENASFAEEVRITILEADGTVVYDSDEPDLASDHSTRPEIVACSEGNPGWAIRHSQTEGRDYCYLAKKNGDCIIRVAVPYEVDLKHFLRPNTIYIVLGVLMLLAVLFILGRAMLRSYKSLEDALEDVENEKQTNKRLKREMTHNIAHELRTPVSSLRGYLEALVECDDIDEDRKKLFTQRAYLQSLRLSDLLRDIGLVTKIEESPEQIKKERLSLYDIVSDVLDEFSEKMQARGIAARNDVPDDLEIDGSPSLVYAIFRNLVENSCKYAGKNVTVVISAEKAGDEVQVRYYDTGTGVPEDMLDRIFERFYRIPGKSSEDYRDDVGSGLGLSVVRNAVAFHGGTIKAALRKEGGLEFEFSLS
jgi:signal transduction histidine kinase